MTDSVKLALRKLAEIALVTAGLLTLLAGSAYGVNWIFSHLSLWVIITGVCFTVVAALVICRHLDRENPQG